VKLYERFGDSGFHSCITTTFGIDFDAYESITLPRLRGANCFNNMLLVDSRMLTYALDGASRLPEHAGRHYTVTGVDAKAVFHPKITLQLGRRSGRAIISSANMTASGLAGNLELAGQITCTQEPLGEARLIAAVWAYLESVLGDQDQALAHQLEWLRVRTPWLLDIDPASEIVNLADGTAAALLTGNGNAAGIGTRFTALVDGERVERLVVLGPYWDEDLSSLIALASALTPSKLAILIDRKTELFPAHAARSLKSAELFDLNEFGMGRFIHAKAIIVETELADHVLFGSANCTVAALGTGNYVGANHEACLYRRLPPRSILAALGLDKVIDEGIAVRPDELPAYRKEEPLPLAEAAQRSPGRFECAFDTLFWHPPRAGDIPASIELLNSAGDRLPIKLTPLNGDGEKPRRFQMSSAKVRPAFARLRFIDEQLSAPAIVALVDALRETIREARGKKAEAAAFLLSDETEEGLWLWEVLNDLEVAELAQREQSPAAQRRRASSCADEIEEQHQTFEYEEFIKGRRPKTEGPSFARNSLAGSELSLVRDFLNRVLMMGDDLSTNDVQDEHDVAFGLDLGDETADAAGALEHGEDFAAAPGPVDEAAEQKEAERGRVVRARATRDQIIHAIEAFSVRLKEKMQADKIGSIDALRLRAMLMIIVTAAQPRDGGRDPTSLQVLPLNNEADGWPRLIGRLLYAFFGGNCPAIRHLKVEAIHDQLPDDILESWATALWAVQAGISAVKTRRSLKQGAEQQLMRLAEQIYARTGLHPHEFGRGVEHKVFTGLNDRFAPRLGLRAEQLLIAHEASGRAVGSLDQRPV
jgi:hypothetical protein